MKKITKITSAFLLALISMPAMAQELGKATVTPIEDEDFIVNGGYGTDLIYIGLTWNYDGKLSHDENVLATVAIDEGTPQNIETYWWDETYEQPDQGKMLILNMRTIVAPNWENKLGVYTVQLPEGLVKNTNGQTNEAQTLTFHLCDFIMPRDISYNPAKSEEYVDENWNELPPPTYTADQLKAVTITFKNVEEMFKPEATAPITATLEDDENTVINLDNKASVSGNTLVLDLSSLAAGSWNITIPQGTIVGDYWDIVSTNHTLQVPYIIYEQLPPMDEYQILKPDNTEYMTTFTYVRLTFTEQEIVFTDPNPTLATRSNTPVDVTFGGETYKITPTIGYSDYDKIYYLQIDFTNQAAEAQNPCGEYLIEIPAELVKNADGDFNEAINLTFEKYNTLNDTDLIITPEQGEVEDLTEITIDFDGFEPIEINEDAEGLPIVKVSTLSDDDSDVEAKAEDIDSEDDANDDSADEYTLDPANGDIIIVEGKVTLKLKEVTPGNTYTISVPKYFFIAEEYWLQNAFELVYTVKEAESGVVEIYVEGVNEAVYNLNGVKVSDKTTDSLPAGIYIINGKKVSIRK